MIPKARASSLPLNHFAAKVFCATDNDSPPKLKFMLVSHFHLSFFVYFTPLLSSHSIPENNTTSKHNVVGLMMVRERRAKREHDLPQRDQEAEQNGSNSV